MFGCLVLWYCRFEGISWNSDETHIAYVAEEPSPAKPTFNDQGYKVSGSDDKDSSSWKGQGDWEEDWGETYAGKKQPALFVINITRFCIVYIHYVVKVLFMDKNSNCDSDFTVERFKPSKALTNLWVLAKLCGFHQVKALHNIWFLLDGHMRQENLVLSTAITGLVHYILLKHHTNQNLMKMRSSKSLQFNLFLKLILFYWVWLCWAEI